MSKKKKETTKKDVEVNIEEIVEEAVEVKEETLEEETLEEETIEKTVEESKPESKATINNEELANGTFRGSLTGMEVAPEPEKREIFVDGIGQAIGYTISGYKILNDSTLIIELGSSRLIRISPDGKVAFRKKL